MLIHRRYGLDVVLPPHWRRWRRRQEVHVVKLGQLQVPPVQLWLVLGEVCRRLYYLSLKVRYWFREVLSGIL